MTGHRSRIVPIAALSLVVGLLWTKPSLGDPSRCETWRVAPTSNLPDGSDFEGAWGVSSTDAWAVGEDSPDNLIAHWDGSEWTSVASNDPTTTLYDVAAISQTDAWAVGDHWDPVSGDLTPRVLHWDGTAWGVSPTPGKGDFSFLYSVSADSPTDVWAVGMFDDRHGFDGPGVLHYDGRNWQRVRTAGQPAGGHFEAVHALAPDDVWAVGLQWTIPGDIRPLIEHWDGTAWTITPTPPIPGEDNVLEGVAGAVSDDVWAVGGLDTGEPPIVLHWDGSLWRVVVADARPGRVYSFDDAVAVATDDVWAAGHSVDESGQDTRPAAEHWDGTAWTDMSPRAPGSGGTFRGIGSSPSGDVWAVGFSYDSFGVSQPLAEHSFGPCAVPMSNP
jgi:hypothetical protein